MNDNQACQATLEDLRDGALSHYEDIARRACDWSSAIPKAIRGYFDRLIAERDAALSTPVPMAGGIVVPALGADACKVCGREGMPTGSGRYACDRDDCGRRDKTLEAAMESARTAGHAEEAGHEKFRALVFYAVEHLEAEHARLVMKEWQRLLSTPVVQPDTAGRAPDDEEPGTSGQWRRAFEWWHLWHPRKTLAEDLDLIMTEVERLVAIEAPKLTAAPDTGAGEFVGLAWLIEKGGNPAMFYDWTRERWTYNPLEATKFSDKKDADICMENVCCDADRACIHQFGGGTTPLPDTSAAPSEGTGNGGDSTAADLEFAYEVNAWKSRLINQAVTLTNMFKQIKTLVAAIEGIDLSGGGIIAAQKAIAAAKSL